MHGIDLVLRRSPEDRPSLWEPPRGPGRPDADSRFRWIARFWPNPRSPFGAAAAVEHVRSTTGFPGDGTEDPLLLRLLTPLPVSGARP
ncbi:hypothetical protein [Chthonobacter albigriseus]|uniref:hypothetical protein n=1 Tax=Chthonobacter albigriseus TaxID=1683161 RepID=UPI0015EF0803|nr:hypothetical protein [Chthonobacter albigriseus]